MANREAVEKILAKMEKSNPGDLFKSVNDLQMGIGAVLQILQKSQGEVTAGQISEEMGVSTARVAVLLKKMVAKGLITKEKGVMDARVTIVRLTQSGEKIASKMRMEMWNQVENMIDRIGEERVLEFIEIANEIRGIVKVPDFHF
ncbi:MAG: MarR family winged helix-turn-helix transcriptional regulator [Muricoprocola sp.]